MSNDYINLSPAQRRRKYMQEHPDMWKWDETEALSGVRSHQTDQQPETKPAPEPKTVFQSLLENHPQEEVLRLIDEFPDDEGLIEYASKVIKPKEETEKQETLKQEFLQRRAALQSFGWQRAIDIKELRQEMQAKGLEELPEA